MDMSICAGTIEEINILKQFNLDSLDTGLKIHSSQAETKVIEAAERLFDKGFIDHKYGGYLTHRGIEAAQHIQRALTLLEA